MSRCSRCASGSTASASRAGVTVGFAGLAVLLSVGLAVFSYG